MCVLLRALLRTLHVSSCTPGLFAFLSKTNTDVTERQVVFFASGSYDKLRVAPRFSYLVLLSPWPTIPRALLDRSGHAILRSMLMAHPRTACVMYDFKIVISNFKKKKINRTFVSRVHHCLSCLFCVCCQAGARKVRRKKTASSSGGLTSASRSMF